MRSPPLLNDSSSMLNRSIALVECFPKVLFQSKKVWKYIRWSPCIILLVESTGLPGVPIGVTFRS